MVWSCCSASLCSLGWRYDHPQTFSRLFWGFPTEISCRDWPHTQPFIIISCVSTTHTLCFSLCTAWKQESSPECSVEEQVLLVENIYSVLPLMETTWWFSPEQCWCLHPENDPGRSHQPGTHTHTHSKAGDFRVSIVRYQIVLHDLSFTGTGPQTDWHSRVWMVLYLEISNQHLDQMWFWLYFCYFSGMWFVLRLSCFCSNDYDSVVLWVILGPVPWQWMHCCCQDGDMSENIVWLQLQLSVPHTHLNAVWSARNKTMICSSDDKKDIIFTGLESELVNRREVDPLKPVHRNPRKPLQV